VPVRQATGTYYQLGSPVVANLFRKRPALSIAFVEAVLNWPIRQVLPTHGVPVLPETRGGREVKMAVEKALLQEEA